MLRLSWLRYGFDRPKRRNKSKKDLTRKSFFEPLEARLVLNAAPVAKEDLRYATDVDTALVVSSSNDLLENDWDPEGSSLTASIVANPSNGSISNFSGSAGTFTYTPNSSFSGLDSFTYRVSDGSNYSETVSVAVAVGGHFGPRINLEEIRLIEGEPIAAMPAGCVSSSRQSSSGRPVKRAIWFSARC